MDTVTSSLTMVHRALYCLALTVLPAQVRGTNDRGGLAFTVFKAVAWPAFLVDALTVFEAGSVLADGRREALAAFDAIVSWTEGEIPFFAGTPSFAEAVAMRTDRGLFALTVAQTPAEGADGRWDTLTVFVTPPR